MNKHWVAAAAAAALVAAGCTEVAQEPGKVYAGKEDQKAYAGDQFRGDKAAWEKTLALRADKQNDYIRTRLENQPK
jgi:outer membrane lipoprotein SlyB